MLRRDAGQGIVLSRWIVIVALGLGVVIDALVPFPTTAPELHTGARVAGKGGTARGNTDAVAKYLPESAGRLHEPAVGADEAGCFQHPGGWRSVYTASESGGNQVGGHATRKVVVSTSQDRRAGGSKEGELNRCASCWREHRTRPATPVRWVGGGA